MSALSTTSTAASLATIGTTVDEVLALVDELADVTLRGEEVDQRAHARQTAAHALAAGADDEVVAAALLHDIGRVWFLARTAPGVPHEDVGARFVADRFGERTTWLVANHVTAKRHLVTLDEGYRDLLTPASRASLGRQGGALPAEHSDRFARHLWAADALELRRWDDQAKVVGAPVPSDARLAEVLAGAWRA